MASPVITWSNPSNVSYGTALDAAQLDASTTIPGTFVYSPAPGTVLPAGTNQTLSVTFTPDDTADYLPVTTTATVNVQMASPVITWSNPANITYGTALDAAQGPTPAPPSRAPSFTRRHRAPCYPLAPTRPCRSPSHPTTPPIIFPVTTTATINVQMASPVITWSNPASITYGTALDAAQLDASTTIPGTFVYSSAPGTVLPAGTNQTLSVTFTPTDSADYLPVTTTAQVTVNQAPLWITAISATKVYGQENPAFTATYAGFKNSDSPASLGGTLRFTTVATVQTLSTRTPSCRTASRRRTMQSPSWPVNLR